jgi:L-threonylcarbamoyladenylate synthase
MEETIGSETGVRVLTGDDPESVVAAAAALRAGQVIAIPTDTVYGLAAAIDIPAAIQQLFALKKRPDVKSIPVLLGDVADAPNVCSEFPALAAALAELYWPGPLTIVVPAHVGLSGRLTGQLVDGRRSVAVRVPDHAIARAIIGAAGGALAVTSANVSGHIEALDASTALRIGSASPAVVVDGGPATGGRPSTIVVATGRTPILIREGAIPFAEIVSSVSNYGEL